MVAEYTQAERVTFNCVEYLGFSPNKDGFAKSRKSVGTNEELAVDPAKEVVLEVYGHPDAQVRVYVRPHTPTLIILNLLEKIATAIELEQQIRSEVHSPNERQPRLEEAAGDRSVQRGGYCRRCLSALDERSFIRDLHGPLCINCGKELQLV
jgi:hypothetical protein